MKFNEKMLLLYAVTDRAWIGKQTLLEQIENALEGGATIVQLREKKLDEDSFVAEAIQVLDLCHKYNVPLIIDDRVDVALGQFRLAFEDKGEHIACLEARKHFAWYLRGVSHSSYYKTQISAISTMEDIERIAKGIKNDLV